MMSKPEVIEAEALAVVPNPAPNAMQDVSKRTDELRQAFDGVTEITNDADYERAAILVQDGAKVLKTIKDAVGPSVKAAHEAHKAAKALENGLSGPVQAVIDRGKALMKAYQDRLMKAAAEERARQQAALQAAAEKKAAAEREARDRELAALREAQGESERKAQRLFDAKAKLEGFFGMSGDMDANAIIETRAECMEAEAEVKADADAVIAYERLVQADEAAKAAAAKPITAPTLAPVQAGPKVAGVSTRTVHKWEVTDKQALPWAFLMPNEKAIAEAVREHKMLTQIPGVRVWEEQEVSVRRNG